MTVKALVIGSSHVGCLRGAAEGFMADRPEVTLAFYGVMGPNFLPGTIGKDQVFQPRFRAGDSKGRDFAIEVNGTDSIDTTPFDHVLLVGHRFGFDRIAGLLAENDLLEGARTGRPRVIPQALLNDAIRTVAGDAVERFLRKTRGRPGLSVALAPYPATSVVESTRAPDLARICRDFWAHPDAQGFFDAWLGFVESRLADGGHRLLHQPRETVAGPFATIADYASGRRTMSGESTDAETDHRHMNADFGRLVLDDYHRLHLKHPIETGSPAVSDAAE
jgi:hypothetical protein